MCSIARSLEVFGERWTMLIIRDVFQGIRRFNGFQESLGISKHVLAERLDRLVDEGILERRLYQERPERHEYVLTPKGLDMWKILVQLVVWGDEHYLPEVGPPRFIRHRGCGGSINDRFHCDRCGQELERDDLELTLGPALEAPGGHPRYPWHRPA